MQPPTFFSQFMHAFFPIRPKHIVLVVAMLIVFLLMARLSLFGFSFRPASQSARQATTSATASTTLQSQTLWPYQCIDTMKYSRDKARQWQTQVTQATIANQMQEIKGLGANCVAIDTPYDAEFLPYLTAWVNGARAAGLHVWFRGNWSSWEGWFDYPTGMTMAQHESKTKQFLKDHSDLFQDGDIFTPAPEAENGGPFNPVKDYDLYRQFLLDEYTESQQAFAAMNKKVIVNWFSMNGGTAQSILDPATIAAVGNTVTIDHYVKSPDVMASFIDYFNRMYGTKVVIGEFGAPIPDINGSMTEAQQAAFIQSIMQVLYQKKSLVGGINYWVLNDSSTALLNEDGVERQVAEVIRNYYMPGAVSGTVTNTIGQPLSGVPVSTSDGSNQTITDTNGRYELLLPAGQTTTIRFGNSHYFPKTQTVTVARQAVKPVDMALMPTQTTFFYRLRAGFHFSWF